MTMPHFDMPPPRLTPALLLLLITVGASSAADTVAGLRVPPGFEVREFAVADLAREGSGRRRGPPFPAGLRLFRDRRRRLPQPLRLRLQRRRRTVHVRLGQRAVRGPAVV